MINAAYPVLSLRPKALDSIRMSITQDINLFGMRHRSMFVTHDWKRIVNPKLIGINLCAFVNVIGNDWINRASLYVLDLANFQLPTAFYHAENRRLGLSASSLIISRPFAGVFVLFFP